MTLARYAVYFAPDPGSDLWALGSRWLGRDAATGCFLERPEACVRKPLEFQEFTAMPAHYGFHATLKPPFHLAEGQTPDELLAFASAFANRQAPIALPALHVSLLGDFIALIPTEDREPISALAAACVGDFDIFRAPTTADDLKRRAKSTLTPRQTELLQRWGYPYVMDEFRFHLTLTGPLNSSQQAYILPVAKECFWDVLTKPCVVDAISIFEQPEPNSPLHILERYSLRGPDHHSGVKKL